MTVGDFSPELRPPARVRCSRIAADPRPSRQRPRPRPVSLRRQAASWTVAAGRRIDVHHHFTSPGWFKELEAANLVPSARKGWTPAKTLEAMDKSGTATSLISTGQAGGAFTPDRLKQRGVTPAQAAESIRRLAREANEYGTKMAADYPGRFVLMASLPMPDLDASLKELEYALDTLKAGGAFLPTSYVDKYIGDPAFTPLLEELNRRKVTVYTHPTDAACCIGIIPKLIPNVIEYGTDTTRMIMSLIVNDAPNRFRDIRWIFSHAGGTLPFLVERIVGNDGDLADDAEEAGRARLAARSAAAFLLRHGAGRESGRDDGAQAGRRPRSDRLRDRLPLQHHGRPHPGTRRMRRASMRRSSNGCTAANSERFLPQGGTPTT